ncbi:MAG: hydrogenase maturation nickel metallochaperone HypA [Propionibacteriaceae bacterium]|jgi:hydrogenase nickel incorporation protein HypA/HybF|nr:hydrogenase maturation nickel metallochaperone HypA [Propionibacteriaceae bacterium]
MHELGLLQPVVRNVGAAAERAGGKRVASVGLRVGARTGTELDALTAAWPLATAGTLLEGAALDVDWVEAAIWCPGCRSEVKIDQFYALRCPACGTPSGALVRGNEFEIVYAETLD